MTSHQLAIAKASLLAGLIRPDPISVSREETNNFYALLKAVTTRCSPENVQRCKQWILENIYQSSPRSIALGKYLAAFMASLGEPEGNKETSQKTKPSTKRQRLHILYLINDILYHRKYHSDDSSVSGKIQPSLVGLIGSCASFKSCPKHHSKILGLIQLWKEKDYFSDDFISKLRIAAINAQEAGQHVEASVESESSEGKHLLPKSIPYIMPASHGDLSTPWYDLPAGNLMPHIIPNSTRPINPEMIKPLQFVTGPADEALAQAVKKLLDDVQVIFDGEADSDEKAWDIDELGQNIILDEITGDIIDGEGYYGWSRNFCEKMKRRKNGLNSSEKYNHRGRQSRSVTSSPGVKKRRYSGSDENQDRSRRRRRSYSSSRSSSSVSRRTASLSRSNSKSRPRSRSRAEQPQDKLLNNMVSNDGTPRQSLLTQIPPPFQQDLNPNFPIPPIPLPNMHFNPSAPPFGAWPPPPPIPFPLDPNTSQFGTWPPAPFPLQPGISLSATQSPQPGQFQQQSSFYSFPGWQENVAGQNQFGWNVTQQGGQGGNRGKDL